MNFIKTQKRSVKQMALRLVRVQRHLSQLDDGMMSHLLRKFDRKKYQGLKISKYQNIYDRELTIARLVPQFVNRDSAETLHSMDL